MLTKDISVPPLITQQQFASIQNTRRPTPIAASPTEKKHDYDRALADYNVAIRTRSEIRSRL